MRIVSTVLVGMMVIWSWSPVYGETYQWEDDQGGVHFTDNANKIPAKYRKKVRQRESMSGEGSVVQPAPRTEPLPAAQQKQQRVELFGGQPVGWWQQRFAVLKRDLAAASAALNEKQEALQQAHHAYRVSLGTSQIKNDNKAKDTVKSFALNSIGAKRKAYYDLQAEVPEAEAKVKDLEGQLVALQAEADAAGVPAEFR